MLRELAPELGWWIPLALALSVWMHIHRPIPMLLQVVVRDPASSPPRRYVPHATIRARDQLLHAQLRLDETTWMQLVVLHRRLW